MLKFRYYKGCSGAAKDVAMLSAVQVPTVVVSWGRFVLWLNRRGVRLVNIH